MVQIIKTQIWKLAVVHTNILGSWSSLVVTAVLVQTISIVGVQSICINDRFQENLLEAGMSTDTRITLIMIALLAGSLACTLLPQPASEVEMGATSVSTSDAARVIRDRTPPTITPTTAKETAHAQEELPSTQLRIAYVKDGDVWYWEEGSESRPLTDRGGVEDVILSDDGKLVVYTRQRKDGRFALLVTDIEERGFRPLVHADQLEAMKNDPNALGVAPYRFDWVPGTHTVIYNTLLPSEAALILQDDLRLVNADNGTHTDLLAPGKGGAFYYSPDGSQIAVVQPNSISVMNADGSERRELFRYVNVYTYSEFEYYVKPLWFSDGSRLMVVIPAPDPLGDPTAPTKVWEIPVDGSEPIQRMSIVVSQGFSASLSPDLTRLAYHTSTDPDTVFRSLEIVELDGAQDITYDQGEIFFHSWAPAGERFVYTLDNSIIVGELGEPPQAIGREGPVYFFRWVDDSSFIYIMKLEDGWQLHRWEDGSPDEQIDRSSTLIRYDFIQ